MGWSFRKSASFGPFRLNLSKSGIGASFGVKGARISMNSKGTYVNLGANGLYYRQKISGTSRKSGIAHQMPPPDKQSANHLQAEPDLITTPDVEQVTDVDSRQFINDLEEKSRSKSLLKYLGVFPSIVIFLYALSFSDDIVGQETRYKDVFKIKKRSVIIRSHPTTNSDPVGHAYKFMQFDIARIDSSGWIEVKRNELPNGFIRRDMGDVANILVISRSIRRIEKAPEFKYYYTLLLSLLVAWCVYLSRIDRKRKTLEILYTLDGELNGLHKHFLELFLKFTQTGRVWQNLKATSVSDSKYHAGASQLVTRVPVGGIYRHKLPLQYLKTNVSIPCVVLKGTELYFFPERLIVKRGQKFGAAFYKNIRIESSNVRFIEDGSVPRDAQVVDSTWKYPNKSGGPDRRFSDNRQLPICLYTEYSFQSEGGLNEVITTSKVGGMDEFVKFIAVIGEYQQKTSNVL